MSQPPFLPRAPGTAPAPPMPPVGVGGKPPPPPDTQQVATAAVQSATHVGVAQRVSGTIAAAGATPLGAVGVNGAANIAMAGVGNVTSDTPEVPLVGYSVMWAYQAIKNHPRINQNRDQAWLLPGLALVIGFIIWVLLTQGDWVVALAKAVSHAGIGAVNAALDYKTLKPLGILGPASDPAVTGANLATHNGGG